MSMSFADHTIETAPPAARRALTQVRKELGYLPVAAARMAASPQLLDGFLRLSGMFEGSSLDPLAREVVVMALSARNGCQVCLAMHTARLTRLGAEPALITALRAAAPLGDARLEAVRILEVVLGIGTYTMSTLANRLTGAPVDGQLSAFA
jgi:AhpD family alkylhydroperoxidase